MMGDDYKAVYSDLLKMLNKDQAVSLFEDRQPEKKRCDELKVEIRILEENLQQDEIVKSSLETRISSNSIVLKQQKERQSKLLNRANEVCQNRENLLALLPEKLRGDGLGLVKESGKVADDLGRPASKKKKLYESAGMISKLIYGKKLKKFDDEFAKFENNLNGDDIKSQIDITKPYESIKNGIVESFERENVPLHEKIKSANEDLAQITEKMSSDKKLLESKKKELQQQDTVLKDKSSNFETLYDSHPFIDNSYIDPVVQQALDNGQIRGTESEKLALVSILSKGCKDSSLAKDVIHSALTKGTNCIIWEQESGAAAHYSEGAISISPTKFMDRTQKSDIETISTLAHEFRHAMQDTDDKAMNDNLANTIMKNCLFEEDAYSVQCGVLHQLNAAAGEQITLGSDMYHISLQKAFEAEYANSHDLGKAMNASALEWNKNFGDDYKAKYLADNWCQLKEDAKIIHPQEIAQRSNIQFEGKQYLDLEKLTEQNLTISQDQFNKIVDDMNANGEKDESLAYFSTVKREKRCDENGKVILNKMGRAATFYQTTPAQKKFDFTLQDNKQSQMIGNETVSLEATSTAQLSDGEEKASTSNASSKSQSAGFVSLLRKGNNPNLAPSNTTDAPVVKTDLTKVNSYLNVSQGKGYD